MSTGPPTNSPTKYSGAPFLEALESAKNYNEAVFELSVACIDGSRTVLDVGAGRGEFSKRLLAGGFDVACVEPDSDQLKLLEVEGFTTWRNIEDANHGYDAVTLINVLEHIEDDAAFLSKLKVHLRPDGVIFIFVPAGPRLYSKFDALIGHHRRYTRSSLKKVVESTGFVVERMESFDSIGMIAAAAFKLSRHSVPTKRSIDFYDRFAFPLSLRVDRLLRSRIGKNIFLSARNTEAR